MPLFLTLPEIEREIETLERIVFDALTYQRPVPHITPEGEQRELAKHRFAHPRLLGIYEALSDSGEEGSVLFLRCYTLARHLIHVDESLYGQCYLRFEQKNGLIPELTDAIRAIAREGRLAYRHTTLTQTEHLAVGRCFCIDGFYAVNLLFPQRGCSSSSCSNCHEPSVFADQECGNCGLAFLGPFHDTLLLSYSPTRETWAMMPLEARIAEAETLYRHPNRGRLRTTRSR
jgi:hypothetical protein